jgi:hypothetical protein
MGCRNNATHPIKNRQSKETNWQQDEDKQSKNTTQYVLDSTIANKNNNVNNTRALLQTRGGEDEHRFYTQIVMDIITRTQNVKTLF